MIERRAYLFLGILHIAFVVGITTVVGGYMWIIDKRADVGFFIFGGFVGIAHLLTTLMQVDRVLRMKAQMKIVACSNERYWRFREIVMGAIAAILQGLAVPIGIEKLASPALITAAVINVAMIVSGTLLGLAYERV